MRQKGVISIFLASVLILMQGGIGLKTEEAENRARKPVAAPLKGVESQERGEENENLFHSARNYSEILEVLNENSIGMVHWEMNHYYTLDAVTESSGGVQNDGMAMPDASESIKDSVNDYSDTNAQVEGIAEADIVKTDGEYLYILSKSGEDSKIFIIRTEGGALSLESSFSPEDTLTVWQEEMYISENRLAIVRCGAKRQSPKRADDALYYDWGFGYYGERQTQVLIYDIADKKAPILIAEHIQDGDYISSREKDGFLYVISEKGIYYNYIQNFDLSSDREEMDTPEFSEKDSSRLPQVDDVCLPANSIYFRDKSMDSSYTIVTSICLEQPEKLVDNLSFLADSDHCYMSGNAIYLAACDWWDYGQKECDHTDIVKISYQDGKFLLAAQGRVKGSLDDQFSMDEKDNYLRVVTTVDHYQLAGKRNDVWQQYLGRSNSLYVLDTDLKLVGSLENLAEGERIYSVRFLGDIAYFVTFRNIDPLFSVDVSDPEHPVLLGALKIPGFSDYLHPYGENLLLGIGYDAGEDGAINCVKLTMFDISNPQEVVEKHTLLLKDYDASEACSNHRAVLVDENKSLIGLPLSGSSYGDSFENYMETKAYAVYGYDEEKGFYQKLAKKYVREWDKRYYYGFDLILEQEIRIPDENSVQKNSDIEWDKENAEENVSADDLTYYENNWYDMRLRGVYIGNYFYTVNSVKEVCSWQMEQNTFQEKEQIKLR